MNLDKTTCKAQDNNFMGSENKGFFYEEKIMCRAPTASLGNACNVDATCDTTPGDGDGVCTPWITGQGTRTPMDARTGPLGVSLGASPVAIAQGAIPKALKELIYDSKGGERRCADPETKRGVVCNNNNPDCEDPPGMGNGVCSDAGKWIHKNVASGFRPYWESLHDEMHDSVGGELLLPPVAAEDPVFWLAHDYFDCMWAAWETLHDPDYRPDTMNFPGDAPTPTGEDADTVMAPWNVKTIRNVYKTQDLDYVYAGTNCNPLLNHFMCYEVRKDVFPGSTVTLRDQFGSVGGVFVERPERLCAPADKNDEDPEAPCDPDHLTGYRIRHTFTKMLNQRIANQFGTTFVDVTKRDRLLVPSAKSLTAAPPAPVAPSVDHFQCYKVKRTRGTPKFVPIPGVKVKDQFGTVTVTLKRPLRLCAPVDKNGQSPGAGTHPDHLLCYRTAKVPFAEAQVFLNDQFGPLTRTLIRRQEFCVPSLKNPPTTTTGTTTTSTTTSTTTTTVPLCGNGVLDPGEQCDPPGSITCPSGSPAGAFLPCNGDCTCPPVFFRDEVDNANDPLNPGCHYAYSDALCTLDKTFFKGDECGSVFSLFEWTDPTCHQHGLVDQSLVPCDIFCAAIPGFTTGTCVTVANFCGMGQDSAHCVCQ